MPKPSFPAGQYFAIAGNVRPGRGGLTRLMLLRQRLFYEAGVEMPLLTFDQNTDYKIVHQQLVADGYLHPEAEIWNIWRWFVDHELLGAETGTELKVTPIDELTTENFEMDGRPWLAIHNLGDKEVAKEYFRTDGKIAIRLVSENGSLVGLKPGIELVNASGLVTKQFESLREFYRFWVTVLTPGNENVFLISDSRIIIPNFLNMGIRYFTFLQIHTPHSSDDRHFLAPIRRTYRPALEFQNQLDALCTLTQRQKSDITKRFGAADNLFVLPPPVMPAKTLGEQKHVAYLISTTTRFHPAKRTDRSIRAFAELLKKVPIAQFDIYGDGELHEEVTSLISDLGLESAINLRGYDPNAREKLNDAVCYWNTSEYEGYSLATLEAMSQGCPVVAFDVKYGLNEQVIDGYNGFLAKPDDIASFVEHTISIMEDRELFQRLSKGALEIAARHSPEAYLENTAQIIRTIVENKPHRTKVANLQIENQSIHFADLIKWLRVDPNLSLDLNLKLKVETRTAGHPLRAEHFFLELVSPQSEELVRLPMKVDGEGETFFLRAKVSPEEMKAAIKAFGDGVRHIELRVGFAWGNSTWVHPLSKRIRVLFGKEGNPRAFAAMSFFPKKLAVKEIARSIGRRLSK